MKTLKNLVVVGGLLVNGDPAGIGDQIQLFLDTENIPAFPESIYGTIVAVNVATCGNNVSYDVEYDEADLNGAVVALRPDDVVDYLVLTPYSAKADILSPEFEGIPQAPTPAPGTDTNQIATTAFVSFATANVVKADERNSIVVEAADTDAARGLALLAAYAAAKLLTPNGAALSRTNRAAVIIPPGKYKLATTFILDGNFVDLIALVSEAPSRRLATDYDFNAFDPGVLDLTCFRPGKTLIYTETDFVSTIRQNVPDVRLRGFSVAQLKNSTGFTENLVPKMGAFYVGAIDNTPSEYADMYFWCACVELTSSGGVQSWGDFGGVWKNCVGNAYSFRLGHGDGITTAGVFTAKMSDCEGGPFSFIGDAYSALSQADYVARNCRFDRCKVLGYFVGQELASQGQAGFAGCSVIGCEVESTCVFVDCEAGKDSFGKGARNAGTFIRCRGGEGCFGNQANSASDLASFAGYAEDCIAGANSFGGTYYASGAGKCTGTLVRCTGTGNTKPIRLQGATIRDCRFTATTTGIDLFTLLDSNSKISNTDLIVVQGGTGRAINAGSALNVAAYGCRINNFVNDADGLGTNVTNLVTTSGNICSDSIK